MLSGPQKKSQFRCYSGELQCCTFISQQGLIHPRNPSWITCEGSDFKMHVFEFFCLWWLDCHQCGQDGVPRMAMPYLCLCLIKVGCAVPCATLVPAGRGMDNQLHLWGTKGQPPRSPTGCSCASPQLILLFAGGSFTGAWCCCFSLVWAPPPPLCFIAFILLLFLQLDFNNKHL